MSHTVKTHTRRTKSGRTVTVRQHDRKGGSGGDPVLRAARTHVARRDRRNGLILTASGAVVTLAGVAAGVTIIPGLIAVSLGLVVLGLSFRTPKVRHASQDDDWWDEGAPGSKPRPWLRRPRTERKAAIARVRNAQQKQEAINKAERRRGVRGETERWLDANDELNAANNGVPWWRRRSAA